MSYWEESFVPYVDVLFISKELFDANMNHFIDTLIFNRKEFFSHNQYTTIQFNNFYGYWSLSKDIEYFIVAEQGWYERLDHKLQSNILKEQIKFNSYAAFNDSYLLTNEKWSSMSQTARHEYFKETIEYLDENIVLDAPKNLPAHIADVTNKFQLKAGSNCFGLTLYAMTKQKWILDEWVYAENLMKTMKLFGFDTIHDAPKQGDVLIWYQDGTPEHAATCIGNDLYFNKNSQMIWSPIKIVHLETIEKDFEGMNYKLFRRGIA